MLPYFVRVTSCHLHSKQGITPEPAVPPQTNPPRKHYLQRLAIIAILGVAVATAITGHFWFVRDQEYFSDGLSEQLIHELAKVSGLKVVGRSSAFQFRGKNEDLREVGRKLGVANILEGSVRREGNHVRITADLIKAEDGFQLWS